MIIRVRVQPRSSRETLMPWQDGQWKLCLTAPPVDGKANQACVEFFARELGIAQSRVRIISGHQARQKLIELAGVEQDEILKLTGKPQTKTAVTFPCAF